MIREIRDYFRSLQESMPEIKHFIFSTDEQALREAVGGFDDFYMFVDYGEFGSRTDGQNRIRDGMDVAVTIALPIGVRKPTPDEVSDILLQAFDLCASVRKTALNQQREHPWLKRLSEEHSMMPFSAPTIQRSVGWTLAFKVEGYDILNVKNRLP